MIDETVIFFYQEIRFLSYEIKRLNLPENLVEIAREQDVGRINNVLRKFKKNNSELWERFSNFYREYVLSGSPIIFCDKEAAKDCTEELFIYNPDEVDPLCLTVILMLSNQQINENDLFENFYNLTDALKEKGHIEIAFIMTKYYCSTIETLIEAFK